MTGFGKAIAETPQRKITIEIKSLNSKQLDLSTRVPGLYKEKEMEIRSYIAQRLERGKVDFSIFIENIGKEAGVVINARLLEEYKEQICNAANQLEIPTPGNWFDLLLRMPDVMKADTLQELSEEEWTIVYQSIEKATQQLIDFRTQEGEMLEKLFREKVSNIASMLLEVAPYEKERVEKIRQRIEDALSNLKSKDYDKNRLEQEMIYYIEKLDINEEKHRLDNHLKYFIETLQSGKGQGKKLGFIAQEMGREINTLGSKSNHAEMQKIVVRMKDELEQIKEQVLNVL